MSQAAAVPQGRSVASRAASSLLVTAGGLVWLVVAGIFVFVVPKFVEIFKEFGAALPYLTQFLLAVGGIVANYWYAFGAAWFGAVAGLALWSGLARSGKALALSGVFLGISSLLALVVTVLCTLGLVVPLLSLMNALSAKK
jgi:type IV pilus assembly protein PilC